MRQHGVLYVESEGVKVHLGPEVIQRPAAPAKEPVKDAPPPHEDKVSRRHPLLGHPTLKLND